MKYEWDEEKRLKNLDKHGFDFLGVETVFENLTLTILDNRFDYNEFRFVTIGFWESRIVAVIHTEPDDVIRSISVRKATKDEQERLYKKITN